MSQIKKLAGQTAVYGVSTIIGRAVNFLLVPFYTHPDVLAVEKYGIVTEFYAYVAFFNIIFQFGMETTYFRWANKSDEKLAYNNSMSFVILLSTSLAALIMLLATPISNVLNYPGQESYIYFLTLVVMIDAIVAIPFARLRHTNKAKKFAVIRLTNIGLNIGLNMFFLLLCDGIYKGEYLQGLRLFVDSFYDPDFKVGYVFLSNLIANALFLPMLYKEFLAWKFQLAKEYLKPMLKFTVPLILVGLAGMVNETIDRILLKYLLKDGFDGKSNQEMVSIYGAVYKLSIFMSLVIQAFRYAAEPFFFSKAKDKKSPELYATVMKWFVICCVLIYLGVSLERDFFGYIFLQQQKYHEGLIIVPVLLLANLFLGIYYNQSIWYKLTEKTRYGSIISIIGAIITLAFNFLLIPYFGYVGSAITTLICYFTMSVISYAWGHKHYPVPYKVGNAFLYILSATSLVVLSYFIEFSNAWIQFLVMTAIFIGYMGFVFLMEKNNLKSILKRTKTSDSNAS